MLETGPTYHTSLSHALHRWDEVRPIRNTVVPQLLYALLASTKDIPGSLFVEGSI